MSPVEHRWCSLSRFQWVVWHYAGLGAGQIQTVSQTFNFPKHFFFTPGTHLLQGLPSGLEIFGRSKILNYCALSSELHGMGGIFGGGLGWHSAKWQVEDLVSNIITLPLLSTLPVVHISSLPFPSARKGATVAIKQKCEGREGKCHVKISGNLESRFFWL